MQWHGQLETESFYEYSLLQPDDPVSASTDMFDDGDYLVLAKREERDVFQRYPGGSCEYMKCPPMFCPQLLAHLRDGQPVAAPPEIQTPLSRK